MKLPKKEWEDCPNCPDQGWYSREHRHIVTITRDMAMDAGDPSMEGTQWDWGPEYDQEQCEFCWTNPKSVFYQENKLWTKE